MINQRGLEEFTSFTEEVNALCTRFGMDFPDAGNWYDGHRFRRLKHIYNPKSVVEAMVDGFFSNYWTLTEIYEALEGFRDMDFDGLRADIVRMLGGDAKKVARSLDNAHMEVASILTYNDENSLAAAIVLAYYSVRKDYKLIRELPAGRGFADVIFLPLLSAGKPALEGFAGEILLIGIYYDREK